jgi:hypothetical protein
MVSEMITQVLRMGHANRKPLAAGMKIHAHIVSRNGFTRDALKVAKYFEIEPSQVRSPREFVLRFKDRWNVGVADDLNKYQDDVKTSLDPA